MAQQIWPEPCILITRALINDLDNPYKYTDQRLTQLLLVAAFQLQQLAQFGQSFQVDVVAQVIYPDPADIVNQTVDNNFINLMCLKSACIVDNGSCQAAIAVATAGKDMNASWDLTGVAQGYLKYLEGKNSWCEKYDEAVDDYLDGAGSISSAIMSPFRLRARQYSTPFLFGYLRGF